MLVLSHIGHLKISPDARNRSSGFPSRSDTNRPVRTQKKVRIVKLRVEVEDTLYYSCGENSLADTAKLICAFIFALDKNPVFS